MIFTVEMPANVITLICKFELNRARCFQDMNLQKLADFFLFSFFLFLSRCESWFKTQKHYPISWKFGILKGSIRVHPDTKFGCNTINGHEVINNCSQKITPICCHAYRVNRSWQEAENGQGDKVTIEPQTLCYLKEIELKIMKIQQKTQQ